MTDEIKTGLSRRTLAKGAAWTVPAAAVVAAAPAYAQSLPPVAPDIPNSFGCKWPGGASDCTEPLDKGFRIYIPFDNNTGYAVTVTIVSGTVTAGGTNSRDFEFWPGTSINITAGGQGDFWITWHDDNSGNNKTMTVQYYYTVTSGPDIGTRFPTTGNYSVPVAKVFNKTCSGPPEPTIPTGPAFVPNTGHSNCPPGFAAAPGDEITTQSIDSGTTGSDSGTDNNSDTIGSDSGTDNNSDTTGSDSGTDNNSGTTGSDSGTDTTGSDSGTDTTGSDSESDSSDA